MSKEKIEVIEFHDRDGQRIPLEANNYDETATNNEKKQNISNQNKQEMGSVPMYNNLPTTYQVYMPVNPPIAPAYLDHIANAGVNIKQAQMLIYHANMRLIDNLAYRDKKLIDLQFEAEKQKLQNSNIPNLAPMNYSNSYDTTQNYGNNLNFDIDLIEKFISQNKLVKLDRTYGQISDKIWIRSDAENRHIIIEEKELRCKFEDFLYEKVHIMEDIPQNTINRMWRMISHRIPRLSDSGLTVSADSQVVFNNGTFNLETVEFQEFISPNLFNRFALLYDFNPYANEPIEFEKILDNVFNGDIDSKTRAYEIIGAIISPVARLKRIFVFQGASHGGKTKLAELICCLLSEIGVHVALDISEITSGISPEDMMQTQLIYMQDAADKKLTGKQVSYLKTFAGGNTINQAAQFKMLICTNSALYTGEGEQLPVSLQNRIIVLPFPKAMTLDFDEYRDVYFENERAGIVKKALEAFHKVYIKKFQFTGDFMVNQYTENKEYSAELSDDEREKLKAVCKDELAQIEQRKISNIFKEMFELTDEVNEELSAKKILSMVNEVLPNKVKEVAVIGKLLKNLFGEKLRSDRKNQKTCYNLTIKDYGEL